MSDKTGADEGPMRIDVAMVRQLAELLDDTQLTEIEVEDGPRRVRVARTVTVAAAAPAPVYAPAPPPALSPHRTLACEPPPGPPR